MAVQILTCVLELGMENAQLIRIVAYKFTELGMHDQAIDMFERVLKLRPEEPQSYR